MVRKLATLLLVVSTAAAHAADTGPVVPNPSRGQSIFDRIGHELLNPSASQVQIPAGIEETYIYTQAELERLSPSPGRALLVALRLTPGVTLSRDGTVYLNGSRVEEIRLDGVRVMLPPPLPSR